MLKAYQLQSLKQVAQNIPGKILVIILINAAILLLIVSSGFSLPASVKDTVVKTQANVMVELTFTATRNYPDPFNQVTLDAVFTDPKGNELRVPGFWDGNNKWKVRYSSAVLGTHHFRSVCSETEDKGLNGVTGRVVVKANKGKNLLMIHGAIRVAGDKRHFSYAEGAPFFCL